MGGLIELIKQPTKSGGISQSKIPPFENIWRPGNETDTYNTSKVPRAELSKIQMDIYQILYSLKD